MPQRIQLSRKRGWRKPDNTVVVSRPSRWGNPFSVEEYGHREAVRKYGIYVEARIRDGHLHITDLVGKNLACWCPLPELVDDNGDDVIRCHADLLLQIAARAVYGEGKPPDTISEAAESLRMLGLAGTTSLGQVGSGEGKPE